MYSALRLTSPTLVQTGRVPGQKALPETLPGRRRASVSLNIQLRWLWRRAGGRWFTSQGALTERNVLESVCEASSASLTTSMCTWTRLQSHLGALESVGSRSRTVSGCGYVKCVWTAASFGGDGKGCPWKCFHVNSAR